MQHLNKLAKDLSHRALHDAVLPYTKVHYYKFLNDMFLDLRDLKDLDDPANDFLQQILWLHPLLNNFHLSREHYERWFPNSVTQFMGSFCHHNIALSIQNCYNQTDFTPENAFINLLFHFKYIDLYLTECNANHISTGFRNRLQMIQNDRDMLDSYEREGFIDRPAQVLVDALRQL